MKKRLPEIDDIRGISIIVMILIHTNAYYLSHQWAYITREISQFAVVAFLFCSSYLSLQKPFPVGFSQFVPYIVKRLKRLIVPFVIFFTLYILFMKFGMGKNLSQSYIVNSFLLIGGIDFNWLVLLFVQLIFVTPLIQYLHEKSKIGLYIYSCIALLSSIIFLKYTPLPFYRSLMWLPWSLVIIYVIYFDRLWKNKVLFLWVTLLFGILYMATQQYILLPLHHSFSMYSNKYPPNLYHMSYSLFAVNILYFLAQRKLFSLFFIQSIVNFFSTYSYSLFFIHIIVIEGVLKWMRPDNWIVFFLIVTCISVLIQIGLNKINEKLKPHPAK